MGGFSHVIKRSAHSANTHRTGWRLALRRFIVVDGAAAAAVGVLIAVGHVDSDAASGAGAQLVLCIVIAARQRCQLQLFGHCSSAAVRLHSFEAAIFAHIAVGELNASV